MYVLLKKTTKETGSYRLIGSAQGLHELKGGNIHIH